MKEIRSFPLGETFKEKSPLMSVIVPLVVPTSVTLAPITASPKTSFTVPFTT